MATFQVLALPELEATLKERQGLVSLHPIYRMEDRKPAFHEVLLRLLNKRGDELLPKYFIPTAVQHNLMPALDILTLELLETQFALHRVQPATPLSVNISRHSILHQPYLDKLHAPHWRALWPHLMFELKVGDISRDISAIKNLVGIKSDGIVLCVDYQKGGVRAVELAVDLGFDYLKIDAVNISLRYNEAELANVAAACKEARAAGLKIIFERVETPGDYRAMKKYLPDYVQGYLFAHPSLKFTDKPYKVVV